MFGCAAALHAARPLPAVRAGHFGTPDGLSSFGPASRSPLSSLSGGFKSRLELNEFFLDAVQEKLISALKPPDEKTHGKGGNP